MSQAFLFPVGSALMFVVFLDVAADFLDFVESGHSGSECQYLKSKRNDASGAFGAMTVFMFFHNNN